MKKLVSLALSVLLVFSCMTCMFISPVSATAASSVTVAGENLLADLSAEDFTHCDGWMTVSDNTVTIGEQTRDVVQFTTSSSNQSFYFKANLTANVQYAFSFNLSAADTEGISFIRIFNSANQSETSHNYVSDENLDLLKDSWNFENSISFTINPKQTTEYTFVIRFNTDLGTSDDNNIYLYDFNLAANLTATCSAEGNGTASVVANGANATFTATPNNANEHFFGWYNGDTKVSDALEYTATINLP